MPRFLCHMPFYVFALVFAQLLYSPRLFPETQTETTEVGRLLFLFLPFLCCSLRVETFFPLSSLSLSLFLWASNWAQGSWIGFYRLKRYEHIKNTYSAPYHFGKIS